MYVFLIQIQWLQDPLSLRNVHSGTVCLMARRKELSMILVRDVDQVTMATIRTEWNADHVGRALCARL